MTFRGSSLNNGLVVFVPEQRGLIAVGRIRDDGSFVLFTGDKQGAYPGVYRITVSSLAPSSYGETYGRFEFPRSAIPERFRDPDSIGIMQIDAGKSNNLPIDLPDQN